MSYDIYLRDPATGETLTSEDPHDVAGGTYALGGTSTAWINVTYNYATHFRRVLGEKGIRAVYGMTGADSVALLASGAEKLSGERSGDYWEPSEGNARSALIDMVSLAEMFPNGVWDGD